jgi:hypothetical protein
MENTTIQQEMERVRQEFLQSVDVKVLDSTDGTSSFSAIISSRGPITIK